MCEVAGSRERERGGEGERGEWKRGRTKGWLRELAREPNVEE